MQLTRRQIDRLVASVTIPEIRSSLQRTLDSMEHDPEAECSYRMTALSLLSFFRKNMQVDMSYETDNNPLRSRLIESSTLYFGPLFRNEEDPAGRASLLLGLRNAGYCVDHLVFLNDTQVELFHTYVRETGLVSA